MWGMGEEATIGFLRQSEIKVCFESSLVFVSIFKSFHVSNSLLSYHTVNLL
jgi:hypothetical protein